MATMEVKSLDVDVDQQPASGSPSSTSLEQSVEKPDATSVDLDRIGETQGYVLDETQLRVQLGLAADAPLRTAKDGKTVLIPQPSENADDPLNWPAWKKNAILLIITIAACTPDYGNATGALALLPQATYDKPPLPQPVITLCVCGD